MHWAEVDVGGRLEAKGKLPLRFLDSENGCETGDIAKVHG